MTRSSLLYGIAGIGLSALASAGVPGTEAVEFYNVANKHYFVTATASEARLLDSGAAGEGWKRTGRSFQAWLDRAGAPDDAQPVCRFYSATANSHFYTASAEECAGLKAASSGWTYEGIAFYIRTPTAGQCPSGTVELARVYNDGFANGEGANHRFVDDAALRKLMVDSRWIAEGTAFCAQAKHTGSNANLPDTTSSFGTLAGTWKGEAEWEVEGPGRESETTAALALTFTAAGAISGTGYGCTFTGNVSLGDGFRSFFMGSVIASGCTDPAINGEFRRMKLQRFGSDTLMVKMKRELDDDEVAVSARLTLDGADPPVVPPVPVLEGAWVGTVRWEAESRTLEVEANRPLTLMVSASGAVNGTGFGCTFSGSLADGVVATGCEFPIFDGAYELHARLHHGRLEVELARETKDEEAEIEGTLLPQDEAMPPLAAPALSGAWEGRVSWSVSSHALSASATDAIAFTIAADGVFSGNALGCALRGKLRFSADGREAIAGTVTASGCTRSVLDGVFDEVEFERDGDAVEFELERKAGGVRVRFEGIARPAG